MTGNFYGPASCGWGCGLRRFRCECVSVGVCVCVERHLPATVAYFQVSVQSLVCVPTACRVLLVFFSFLPPAFLPAKYLDYRCRHKLCSPSDNTVPCPLVCPVRVPDQVQNVKFFTPPTVCVCVLFSLFPLPRLEQLFDVCKFCSLSVSELPCSMRL